MRPGGRAARSLAAGPQGDGHAAPERVTLTRAAVRLIALVLLVGALDRASATAIPTVPAAIALAPLARRLEAARPPPCRPPG